MNNHIPLRMCMACREMKNKHELIRFVVQDGKVVIDTRMQIQARGAYLCPDRKCVQTAKKKRCLERHLKADAKEAYVQLESLFMEAHDE